MRLSEVLWLRTTRYRLAASERDDHQLRFDETRKQAKVTRNRKAIMVLLVFTIVSHGLVLPLVFVNLRSTSVAKGKLKIIQNEVRERRRSKYAEDLRELERINGRPFSTAEVNNLLLMLEASEADGDTLTSSITESRDAYGGSYAYSEVGHDAPPSYEASTSKRQVRI